MDKLMQSLVDAPLANALKLNVVELPDAPPKKRAPSVRTLQMYKTEPGIIARGKQHKEAQRWAKVKALLDYYVPQGKTAEEIHQLTGLDMLTIERGMEARNG